MGAAELSLPSISTEHRRFGGNVVEIPNLPHLKVKAFGHDTFQNTVTAAFPKSTTITHVTLWGAMRHGAILSFHQCSFVNESSSILVLSLTFELSSSV
ncbi:Uncharacterized protein HZ326_4467 [Fusarium oxysporum f. sp. albedinis]|nr:Uncharacterized protein HZ326_4467 [Fusarium oxysporum f. sp. albedinis]